MKSIFLRIPALLLLLATLLAAGCGGGGGNKNTDGGGGGASPTETGGADGRMQVTILWPARSDTRVIPSATQRIRLAFTNSTGQRLQISSANAVGGDGSTAAVVDLGNTDATILNDATTSPLYTASEAVVIARPSGGFGNNTTDGRETTTIALTLPALTGIIAKVDALRLNNTAAILATTTQTINITTGTNPDLIFDLASTIASITLTPAASINATVGMTPPAVLTAAAQNGPNGTGGTVVVDPAGFSYETTDSSKVTVVSQGGVNNDKANVNFLKSTFAAAGTGSVPVEVTAKFTEGGSVTTSNKVLVNVAPTLAVPTPPTFGTGSQDGTSGQLLQSGVGAGLASTATFTATLTGANATGTDSIVVQVRKDGVASARFDALATKSMNGNGVDVTFTAPNVVATPAVALPDGTDTTPVNGAGRYTITILAKETSTVLVMRTITVSALGLGIATTPATTPASLRQNDTATITLTGTRATGATGAVLKGAALDNVTGALLTPADGTLTTGSATLKAPVRVFTSGGTEYAAAGAYTIRLLSVGGMALGGTNPVAFVDAALTIRDIGITITAPGVGTALPEGGSVEFTATIIGLKPDIAGSGPVGDVRFDRFGSAPTAAVVRATEGTGNVVTAKVTLTTPAFAAAPNDTFVLQATSADNTGITDAKTYTIGDVP